MFQWQVRRFLDASIESFLAPFVESFERSQINASSFKDGYSEPSSKGVLPKLELRRGSNDWSNSRTSSRFSRSWNGQPAATGLNQGSRPIEKDEAYLSGSGEMVYTKLKIKRTMLSALGFPFTVAQGTVGKITVSIPPLFSELPVVVSLDSVLILVVPQDQKEWDVPSAKSSYLQSRRQRLGDMTALLVLEKARQGDAREAAQGASSVSSGSRDDTGTTGTTGMQAYIRNNLQQMLLSKLKVQISNIHIRYEHHPKATHIPVSAPFSWGLMLPYVLLDHASVTSAAVAAARAAFVASQPERRLGDPPHRFSSTFSRLHAASSHKGLAFEATDGARSGVRLSDLKKVRRYAWRAR